MKDQIDDDWPALGLRDSRPTLIDAFRSQPLNVSVILLLGLASIVLNITATLIVGLAIDKVLVDEDLRSALQLCVVATVFYLVGGLLWILQGRASTRLVYAISHRIRVSANQVILKSQLTNVDRFGHSDVHGRVINDVENLSRALQGSISQLSNSMLLTLGLTLVMIYISPILAVVTVATVFGGVLISRRITSMARPYYAKEFGSVGSLNTSILEWLGADRSTREMMKRSGIRRHLDALAADARKDSFHAQRIGGQAQPISVAISYGGYVAVIILGVIQLRAGNITVGAFQAMLLYSRQISGPLSQLASLGNVIQAGLASWGRLVELDGMNQGQPLLSSSASADQTSSIGRVDLSGVSLRYQDTQALLPVDASFRSGEVVFLVGPTGSGKSTLAGIIAGVHLPNTGSLEFDTRSHDQIGQQVAYIPQNAFLARASISDNIIASWHDKQADEIDGDNLSWESVLALADQAGLRQLVAAVEGNHLENAEIDGSKLGIAQRQAVSVLRVLYDTRLVAVLDEPTSALDVETESQVFGALRYKYRDGILIIVAHRLDNIQPSDRVLRITDGQVSFNGLARQLVDESLWEQGVRDVNDI